jgi:replicative DNA helicase
MSTIERLPPHSLEAEEAVLGSLLIDPDALFEVSNFLRPEAFYRTAHKWIYESILSLSERREPLDFVTLTEELRRREQLEEVGGEAYVIGLINAVPTAINARSYGKLVEAAALRRKLIGAASTIANLAYDEAEDINVVIDRSESALFSISEQRTTRDLVPIKQITSEYWDRIQRLMEQGDDIIGVPTGFTDLDRLLGGLNRSDLIILAARPGMGKTSLQNAIALTAAMNYGKRVAIFNLEMSGEQLVQRMIAAQTRIDSQRLRRGQIYENEMGLFTETLGRLSETRIFIDDTPSITTNQLRTKCRRLYAEHGLDLIIIDYLQLMSAEHTTNNRVMEISEISRGLKGLARELDVPVLASAQLSRAVEQRQDKHPQLSDLRDSGCLVGDTLITLADNGRRVPIRDLVGLSNFSVLALNEDTLKIEPALVSRSFATGIKPVFQLETKLGRSIKATGNHKFLTIEGWKRLDEIGIGDHLALPRRLDGFHLTANTNRDIIPSQIWRQLVTPAMIVEGITTRQMQAGIGQTYCGTSLYKQNVSRERAERVAEVINSEELSLLANSDVYWDQIISIALAGEAEVFDLTVPGLHNFVADDIIVHNSIEQDADIVMFIYRDEYYHPDTTERPNIAELTIAKHRNGPTGVIDLYWHSKLATFRNLQRQEINL